MLRTRADREAPPGPRPGGAFLGILRSRLGIILPAAVLAISGVGGTLQLRHWLDTSGYDGVLPICRVDTVEPLVALTFDDGPDREYTPRVLRLLEEHHARATFFVAGDRAIRESSLIEEELTTRMEIGNHTWSHPHLASLTTAEAWEQVRRTGELLGPRTAPVFRAPYGEISPEQLTRLKDVGFTSVHWSLALDHYIGGMALSPSEAAATLAADARPGDIILAHDAAPIPGDGRADRAEAMEALELLLPALEERGLRATTVGALLQSGTPVAAEPRRWFWQSGFECS